MQNGSTGHVKWPWYIATTITISILLAGFSTTLITLHAQQPHEDAVPRAEYERDIDQIMRELNYIRTKVDDIADRD